MKTSLIAVLILLSSTFSWAATTFEPFVGEYKVLGQRCYEDGLATQRGCDKTGIVITSANGRFSIVEQQGRNSSSYPLYIVNEKTESSFETSTLRGVDCCARWTSEKGHLIDGGEVWVTESRSRDIQKIGNKFKYSYSYSANRGKTPLGTLMRFYDLELK